MGSLPVPPTLTARKRTTNTDMERRPLRPQTKAAAPRVSFRCSASLSFDRLSMREGSRSERNVVVDRPGPGAAPAARERRTALACRRAVEAGAAGSAFLRKAVATLAAPAARVEQLHFAPEALQHHLGRVAIGAALVLPFARLQLAFNVNFRALLQYCSATLARFSLKITTLCHSVRSFAPPRPCLATFQKWRPRSSPPDRRN